MILSPVTELTIVGVYDRGVPNQERIVLMAEQAVNLGQFGLMLGYKTAGDMANPFNDHLFWFGDGVIQKGDWILVYTGPGEARSSELPSSDNKMYTVHWGKDSTVLAHSESIPILFRVDAVQVASSPLNLPQSGS